MAEQKLNIKVSTTGAKKSKDELSGLNGAINKMGKAVGVASAAYFGAKGLISAFSTVIEASARQEQAEKALEVALGRTSRALLNQASSLQQVTTAGDEAIIEQQAFLASLKFTEDQIKTIIPVALDLSAATGISLESAVRNTSKTFSGLAGELGELVPQLRELTQEEMKAGKAVEVLGDLFEGQAAKQSDTLAGSLTQMSNAVGDAAEAIGSLFSPIVISTANGIKRLAEGVGDVVERFQNFGTEVEDVIIRSLGEKAPQSLEEFRASLNDLNIGELEALGNQLIEQQKNLTGFNNRIEDVDAFDALLEKLLYLNQELEKQNEIYDNLNNAVERNLDIRRADLDMDFKKVENFEIIKKDMRDQIKLSQNLADALQTAFDPDLGAGEAFKGFILQVMSSMQGVILASKAMSEALTFAFVPGVGAAGSIAALLALEAAKAGVRSIEFAEGGIVPGTGNTDSVPAMLTPGEVILNAAQQENLVGGMGGNVTVNISAPLVDETVVDSIIPAIQTALNEDRATLKI